MSQWSNWATKILKTKYNSMIIFWKFPSPPTERREICETTAFSSIFHQMSYHFSKLSLIRIWYELKYFQTGVVAVILVWLEQYPCSNVYDMTSDRDIWTISDNSYRTLVWYATIWFDVNPWWLQLLLMDSQVFVGSIIYGWFNVALMNAHLQRKTVVSERRFTINQNNSKGTNRLTTFRRFNIVTGIAFTDVAHHNWSQKPISSATQEPISPIKMLMHKLFAICEKREQKTIKKKTYKLPSWIDGNTGECRTSTKLIHLKRGVKTIMIHP